MSHLLRLLITFLRIFYCSVAESFLNEYGLDQKKAKQRLVESSTEYLHTQFCKVENLYAILRKPWNFIPELFEILLTNE